MNHYLLSSWLLVAQTVEIGRGIVDMDFVVHVDSGVEACGSKGQ
jgi:hypothetical protein